MFKHENTLLSSRSVAPYLKFFIEQLTIAIFSLNRVHWAQFLRTPGCCHERSWFQKGLCLTDQDRGVCKVNKTIKPIVLCQFMAKLILIGQESLKENTTLTPGTPCEERNALELDAFLAQKDLLKYCRPVGNCSRGNCSSADIGNPCFL